MTADPTPELVSLALAAAPGPLSIDTLVSWNLARPSDLFSYLSAAQARGELAQPEPGAFTIAPAGRAEAVLAGATTATWAALLADAGRIGWALQAARRAAAEHRFVVANELWRGLVTAAPRERFPGGDAAWVAALLEALRYSRAMYGVAPERFREALAAAVALGDLPAQAVLHGTLGLSDLRLGNAMRAQEHLDGAREAARASGAAGFEGHVYVAIGLATQGRLGEAIDAFEELLGDIPLDPGALLVTPDSPTPASPLLILCAAYCNTGQIPRALDVVDRLRRTGVEHGMPDLEREADLLAAIAHLTRGDIERARPHAERAHAWVAATAADALRLWIASSVLAAVRLRDGLPDEARALLESAWTPYRWSGSLFSPVVAVLETYEQLEVQGVAVARFDLGAELDRMIAGPNLFVRGVGHRYRARRLARMADGTAAAVREDLETAIALLREAGGVIELAGALRDAEGLARGGGRDADARRLAADLRDTARRAPLPGEETACRASRAGVLAELGRLGALSARREGTWGELAARLCRVLGAERCALFESGSPPRLLGGRGGDAAWRDAVQAMLGARAPAAVETLPSPALAGEGSAPLLVVPFAAEGRSGWACLENRHGPAAIGPGDGELLEVLSAQLGVLLANVALWQELTAARERLEQENRYWRATSAAASPGSRLVGDSPALRGVLALVGRVAPTTTAVLVTGETGVGKELVASEIHRQSPRRGGPFIAVHVASFSPGLVASGLFGHERGAFTGATEQAKGRFELADGGTLFLDEVGELTAEDQVRLLRVLQEGAFERVGGTRPIRSDFRLVAATNRDLEAEVRAGRFREDLYFRIAAFPLRVPPLRERREEIPTLALFFMERASRARGVRFEGIGEGDVRRMLEYAWPGNVRELEHVIERAVVLSEPPRLRIPPLDARTRSEHPAPAAPARPAAPELVTLAEAERRHVAAVLRHVRGRITGAGGAAEILGMKPSTLNFRIRKLGLEAAVREARTTGRA